MDDKALVGQGEGIVVLQQVHPFREPGIKLLFPSDTVTDFDFSPFDQLLLATGSADKTVSVQ